MRIITVLLFFIAVNLIGAENITITVDATPQLPAPNLIAGRKLNMNFSAGMANWKLTKNTQSINIEFIPDDNSDGPAMFFKECNQEIYQQIPVKIFSPGKTYIASCVVKPVTQLPFKPYSEGGLGFNVIFFPKDWSKSKNLIARDSGVKSPIGQWNMISGKPFTVPEWATFSQISVGIFYYEKEKGRQGMVKALCVTEAFSQLKVDVNAPVAIRQVKIIDNTDKTIFDSGIITGGTKTFHKVMTVETVHSYTVLVITADGDVKETTYPAVTSKS